ncbi:MAG: DoxX family membrane protein [Acidobacteriota bacterium]|nr:DoxX family membrane protein [Acidobacteriota bacterium]
MKIVVIIARILLGAMMVFGGGMHLLNIGAKNPLPPGLAGEYVHVLMATGYMFVVGALELVPGILLLINRYVPLALTLLGPIVVNIFLAGALVIRTPQGIAPGVVAAALWLLVFAQARSAFAPLFKARAAA